MSELAATFALAQDNSFGQPLESQLRSCLLGTWIGQHAGMGTEVLDTVYWTALLRYVGCTAHAHEVSQLFGDEVAARGRTLVHDAANPAEVVGDVISFLAAGRGPEELEQIARQVEESIANWAASNFATGCEVGDMLARRLEFGADVRGALAFTFERWNGLGWPNGASGDEIPLAMRIVHLSHDMEAIARTASPAAAIAEASERRDRTYDPALVDVFLAHADEMFARLAAVDPWHEVLALEPDSGRILAGEDLDDALTVVADFIDLKSPYMGGHSRRCSDLVERAAALLRMDVDDAAVLRRAALVHEFGATAVPNSIWDKPGPLTRAERDRVETHTLVTEQMLRRSPALAELSAVAASHHEHADGSGYHRALPAGACTIGALVLAAADVYVALTSERSFRPAWSAADAAAEVNHLVETGKLDRRAAEAVLEAAGHRSTTGPSHRRGAGPGGLSGREIEVLALAALGLTTQQIANRLVISPKTADHHIQHVYVKIGVSSRAAAALWAMQNGVVN